MYIFYKIYLQWIYWTYFLSHVVLRFSLVNPPREDDKEETRRREDDKRELINLVLAHEFLIESLSKKGLSVRGFVDN